jgi:hypothetical protein
MAKKTNKKPGQETPNTFAIKKQKNNLNHSRATKVFVILILLAFIVPVIAGLILYLI